MPLTTSRTRLWVTHLSASAGPKPALPIQVNVLSLSQAGGPSTYRREEALAFAAPRQEACEWLETASYGARPRSGSRTTYSGRSAQRSEEHTSELQSLMRTPYAVFCLTTK